MILSFFSSFVLFSDSHVFFKPISNRLDRASATGTLDSGSIPGRVKPKTIKIGIYSVYAVRSTLKRDSVKPPPSVVNRWAGGSVTRIPKSLFAVSWPPGQGNLANKR